MATKYIYLYCRISEDKQGHREGVEAQERWGREYAAYTWPGIPVKVFADNDLSAAKDNVVRPGFQKMRDGIRRGDCAHLWTVEQSRLTRLELEWFSLVGDLVKADVTEVHTKRGGVIDTEGVVGAIMAVLSGWEVRQLRRRLKDKLGELAREGRPAGHSGFAYVHIARSEEQRQRLEQWWQARDEARDRGEDMHAWKDRNPRPAGGTPVLDAGGRKAPQIDPERAELVRWAAAQILNGWTPTEVAREFRRRGIRGVYGGRIDDPGSIYKMLTAPAIAGLRVYQGEIVGKATWEPVLDEATWRAVRARLDGNRKPYKRRTARRYLLSKFAFCASCGQAMTAASTRDSDISYYQCSGAVIEGSDNSCGRMSIQSVPAENYVAGELLAHLASRDIAAPEDEHAGRRDAITAELEALAAQKAEWMQARDAGQLNLAEYLAAKAKFDTRLRQLDAELAGLPAPVRKLDVEQLRQAWPEMTLSERRQVLGDWIERIIIHPRKPAPTARDVARKAGVGHAAVWNLLSGTARVISEGDLSRRTIDRTAVETAVAVRTLSAASGGGVGAQQLAGHLNICRVRASVRLADARDRGYVTADKPSRSGSREVLYTTRPDLPDLPARPAAPGTRSFRMLESTAARIRQAAAELGYELHPRGTPRFDAGRVEIIWRQ
jgi:DNA invertase Pin-like site-specific DNA recombinase